MLSLPAAMTAYSQFVLWIAVPSKTRPGKTDKFPVNATTGKVCDAHDPANWLSAADALACYKSGMAHGVGFVFTDADPFFFLDIDDALQADNTWSQIAVSLCQQFAGCFVEISHSGKGLHIFGSSVKYAHGTRNREYGLELYTSGRFVALTGTGATGDAGLRVDDRLFSCISQLFSEKTIVNELSEWTVEPVAEWNGIENDDELIEKLLSIRPSAGSVFGGKASVSELFQGFTDAYGGDHSMADAALCSHLAFWTGKNCERIDRLFRRSGLMREKWDRSAGQGRTYGQLTIIKAVSICDKVYTKQVSVEQPADATAADPVTGLRDGVQFLSVPAQIEHFKGCVYVRDSHRIFTPDGALLRQDQFRATYGGYMFALDLVNEKTSRNAWEAFTESNGYCFPRAHKTCFRPESPTGALIEEEGQTVVNIYVPIKTAATPGDVTPFINHVQRLLPIKRDQDILLAYMAAIVQYPGIKFQWCPLVQGMEGNGKTLLVTALSACIGRRYTHLPNANDISNKFNAWLLGKLFIGIEEIYTVDRQEAIETLKPLITNSRVEIQGKGDNQSTGDNRANFFLTSNHQDAIRKTKLDRRYCVFYTAQQHPGDLERCGMTGRYFPDIYNWLRGGGFANINHWLRSYAIPDEYNPATLCHRAPETSSTPDVIRNSLGSIEQEILDAIEECRPGFCGGWISSLAFNDLLDKKRSSKQISVNRRREILMSLGYDWHPALKDGRINNHIFDVNGLSGKPKLYLKAGHLAFNLTSCADITKAYMDAQRSTSPNAVHSAMCEISS